MLRESRVDDVVDAVDRERSLGDVGGDDDLTGTGRRGFEDSRLHLRRERRVHGEDVKVGHGGTEALHAFEEDLARRVDLLLAGEEEEDVALGFGEVNLHDGD